MLHLIVERFRNGDPVPVYRRFRDEGRLAPEACATSPAGSPRT
jgi:hypothetical protein